MHIGIGQIIKNPRISNLRAEILTWDFRNTKRDNHSAATFGTHSALYKATVSKIKMIDSFTRVHDFLPLYVDEHGPDKPLNIHHT